MVNDRVFLKFNYEHVKKNNYALYFHFHNLVGKKGKKFPSKSQELK